MENKELKKKIDEELDQELLIDQLNVISGGNIGDAPTSAAEEESEMEKTTKEMGGIGGYGNRLKF